MRLVCDKCSALYTIEDGLVGTRDFRVSCKSCGKPIYVKSARQVTLGATHRVRLPGAALPRPAMLAAVAARSEARTKPTPAANGEAWFVSIDGRQRGPLSAKEVASLFEKGSLDWGNEVWREGLKGWRPARRDALLVTAVAGARGAVNDTTRLDAARSFLAPEDTVVEPRPGHDKARGHAGGSRRKERADATEKHILEVSKRALGRTEEMPQPVAKADALPDLRPSARPQAWHSPENTAFREALGLPTDSSQQASEIPPEPASEARGEQKADGGAANLPGPTLADAFVSATRLLDEQRADRFGRRGPNFLEFLPGHVVERVHAFYQEHVNSHYLVAVASFAAGVLATAMVLGRPVGSHAPAAGQDAAAHAIPLAQAEPSAPEPIAPEAAAPAGALGASVLPVTTVQSSMASSLAAPAPVMRELPTVEDLRREVRKVAPDVRRCVEDPATGVDVDIYLAGATGRVHDVDVRSPLIPPGRAACIMHAVRRMEVSPFSRDELKLMHKFSW